MTPYRSDLAGRLTHFIHHRPATCAAIVLSVWLPLGWAILNFLP